jgi:hypothetical protein
VKKSTANKEKQQQASQMEYTHLSCSY